MGRVDTLDSNGAEGMGRRCRSHGRGGILVMLAVMGRWSCGSSLVQVEATYGLPQFKTIGSPQRPHAGCTVRTGCTVSQRFHNP